MSFPLTAFAEDNCPPGAWFCDDAPAVDDQEDAPAEALPEVDESEPPPPPEALPLPPPAAAPPAPPPHVRHRGRGPQPPVVIYQPAPSTERSRTKIIIIAPGIARPRIVRTPPRPRVVARPHCEEYAPPPPPPAVVMPAPPPAPAHVPLKRRWQSEWGLNLRLQGVGFGGDDNGQSNDAGMGGVGLSLRYRPVPALALEAGVDVLGGTDFNGFERVELPVSLNGILYLNPRSRAQVYLTGGVHWSSATVRSDEPDPRLSVDPENNGYSTEYSYFGGQGGIGLEFRVSRRVALNIDALAFVRNRTNDEGTPAEFTDPETGKTTNISGGGLFRGGLTLWW
jgi:hypothetical protein